MLTIDSIETVALRVPLDRTYRGSYYKMPNRCTIITRVRTAEGIVGEAYNADSDDEQAEILGIIHNELAPALKGADAFAYERCWELMAPATFDQLRDRRLAMQAIACVDTAIWDAIGKALETPVYRLWGGYRSALPMIGIGGYYEDDTPTIEGEVEAFVEHGMVGMKFKIGGASPETDAARLRRAVDTAAPGFVFVVDANQGYTLRQATRFARLAGEFVELRWFEEPCRWPDDRLAMRDFRHASGVPVAAGQSEISHAGMRDLMVTGAIDVCNFDASWGGGPTAWRRVAALAGVFNVQLGHHEEAHLASHLLASQPHGTYVEAFHVERDPVYWQLLANRPQLRDGLFPLPSAPGLGWELDHAFIERYRSDR